MNMNGWDTIYAVSIVTANQALGASLSSLIPSVNQSISGELGNYEVAVEFGAWQIDLGGSTELINLKVPITSGGITQQGGNQISLAGFTALFEVSLTLLAPTAQSRNLSFNFATAGQVGQSPAPGVVVPLGFVGQAPDPSVADLSLNAIATGLVAQATQIAFAFASINLIPPGTNSWLAPCNLAYGFFQNINGDAYLAILSTTGDPGSLAITIDPELTAGGAQAGFAFSLPLFFNNCVIPATAATLPNDPVSCFVLNSSSPPAIVLNQSVGLGGMEVGAITYYPSMDGFAATPVPGELQITANGDCDVYAGLSMSWSTNTSNTFVFNASNQTIGFVSNGTPSVDHDVSVPWYWWALSPMIAGIADGVATLIGNHIASSIGGQVGTVMTAAPPTSVQFAGMQAFQVTNAQLDGAVILTGNSPAIATTNA